MAQTRCSMNIRWLNGQSSHSAMKLNGLSRSTKSPDLPLFSWQYKEIWRHNSHRGRRLLLNPNFISKQAQSLSPSHCVWSQVKSPIPPKKGQRENSHTRCIKNRYQEWSFCIFGFTMIIYCIGWGWINLSLSREDATSVVWVWIRFEPSGEV